MLLFFPSKSKNRAQHLNNGDGLSEYVGQSLGEKTYIGESTLQIRNRETDLDNLLQNSV